MAAVNINNVPNYFSNIHDLFLYVSYLCWLAYGAYGDCTTLLHIVPLQFLLK